MTDNSYNIFSNLTAQDLQKIYDLKNLNLNALRAVVAVAQHRSFTAASAALNISLSTLSSQITAIEAQFQFKIFNRKPHKHDNILTPYGENLLPPVIESLMTLGDVNNNRGYYLNFFGISMLPTFASFWFSKHFTGFKKDHKGVPFCLDESEANINFTERDYHCAIRYGDGNFPNLISVPLIEEYVTPVCSPEYLDQLKSEIGIDVLQINHLKHSTLLYSKSCFGYWFKWLNIYNLQGISNQAAVELCEQCSLAITMAINGHGFAIANLIYAADELQSGKLIAPLASIDGAINPGQGWHLVYPKKHKENPVLIDFQKWIVEAFKEQKLKNDIIINDQAEKFEAIL